MTTRPDGPCSLCLEAQSGRVSRVGADEVALLRVAAEVGGDERAYGRDAQTAGADVVECTADEAAADPTAFLRHVDFGMHEDDHAWRDAIANLPDALTVAENLVSKLERVVSHDVLVGHACARKDSNLRPRAPEARALSPELRALEGPVY